MLNPEMRDLVNVYICIHPLIRHTLRLTCKTLHSWIPIDKKSVRIFHALSGELLLHDKVMSMQTERCIRKLFNTCVYRVPGTTPLRLPTTITSIHGRQQQCYYAKAVEHLETSAAGFEMNVELIDNVIYLCINDMYHDIDTIINIFTEITRQKYRALFYCWKFSFDFEHNTVLLLRTD